MKGLNLSEWAIRHRALVLFLMLLALFVGGRSYLNLGREEDPAFAVGTMVVAAYWPGATLVDTMNELTNTIEEKLEETPDLDIIKSFTKPGESVIYVQLKDSANPANIPEDWYQVRKKIADIKQNLPSGTQGPFFNDEFGDVFGMIYGVTGDGFSLRETRDFAETAREAFLSVPDVGKVEIFGDQKEKVYLTFSPERLAALSLNLNQILDAIAEQNDVTPAGVISTKNEDILIEVSGALANVADLQKINLFISGRFYNLTQIATVTRGYVDPPTKMFEVDGKQAIGIGVSMRAGGNNLVFGDGLSAAAAKLRQEFPIGIDLAQVSDQPQVVREAIGSFTKALYESVLIVLVVSFVSLGFRAGLVVALSIPLVLAIVFLCLEALDISLQRISLGALVISLGLLVDDAMITVELMVYRIEAGDPKDKAATYAYVSTAFPMLTGTLVTIAGFLPIGLAQSSVGQYTFSLFAVIGIALVTSWFVAVVFSPVIGMFVLPATMKAKHGGPGRGMQAFIRVLSFCMRHRYSTIVATLLLFVLSLYGQQHLQRQFFPSSDRPELLVTLILPANSSIFATDTEVKKVETLLKGDADVASYSAYIGGGAIRFYLPLDVQLDNDFIAQLVVVAKDLEARDRVQAKLEAAMADDRYADRQGIPPGARPSGRLADPVPGQRADPRGGAEIRRPGGAGAAEFGDGDDGQFRLEREEQDRPPRRQPGPGAPARPQLRGDRPAVQHDPQRHGGDADPRQHLPRRHRGAGYRCRAAVARKSQEPADQSVERAVGAAQRRRDPRLHARRILCLAPRSPADDHRPGRPGAGAGGADGLQAHGAGNREDRGRACRPAPRSRRAERSRRAARAPLRSSPRCR